MSWTDDGANLLHVDVGAHSFSLYRSVESVDYVEDVVEAAVTGRIRETREVGRMTLRIPLRDGTVATERGYGPLALLPLPRRLRGPRTVAHPPYRAPEG